MQAEIEKLKCERETLIEISNGLKSKLNEYEDDADQTNEEKIDIPRLQAENEVAYERI